MKVKARNLKTSMTSEMNVRIIIDLADEKCFCGYSLNTLIVENAGHIKPTNLRECLDTVMPGIVYDTNYKIIVLEINEITPTDFIEINENATLDDLEAPVKTQRPILRRTLNEIIKDFLESLYKRKKG